MTVLLDYLKTRRSSLSMTLEEPGPDEEQLSEIIGVASRVPDHGKLAPWRFELWTRPARERMHSDLLSLLHSLPAVADVPKLEKGTDKLLHAPCVLVVISKAAEHPKIPVWEQQLSCGAACMNALMAANALGFEAQWLTAWYVYEERARKILRLNSGEQVAGIIHIGTSKTPKSERDRPLLSELFSTRTD